MTKNLLKLIGCGLFAAAFCVPSLAEVDSAGVRVFKNPIPAPGVHPRVFFTAAEADALRQRINDSELGKKRLQPIIANAVKKIHDDTRELMAIDIDTLDAATVKSWLGPKEGLQQNWEIAALKAYLDDDEELKAYLIDVAVRHSKIILASLELVPDHAFWRGRGDAEVNWNLGHEWTLGRGLALTYDYLYNDMSEGQRDVVRRAISAGLKNARSHGLGWPDTKLFSNHVPLHANMGVIALAIEGEEGYDPEIYQKWLQTMRGWLTRCISLGGANHEDGYIYYALRGAVPFMIAAERRGDRFFNLPNLRNIFTWQAHWEPAGKRLGGYQTVHATMKYMYPEDPVMNMFWRRRVGADYQQSLTWQSSADTVLFGMDWSGEAVESADPAALGLPPYAFDPRRGVQIVRNTWDSDDLQFRYSARPDTMFVGHAAVDSGSFELEAFGRNWVYNSSGDKSGSYSSKDFSLLHIDGVAQGMKPPTVKNLFQRDAGAAAIIASDLTYAYNWKWYYGWPQPGADGDSSTGEQIGHRMPQAPWELEKKDPYTLGWPAEEDWLPHDLSAQPHLGYVGIWQHKLRINEVAHVYRTAVTVRGGTPYVIIIDDAKKDDQSRLYEWYMQIPRDLDLALLTETDMILQESGNGADQGRSVVQKNDPRSAPGNKRLLVRVLDPFREMPATQEYFYGKPNFLAEARIETHQYGYDKTRDGSLIRQGKRLVIPHRGTAGDFKMLLFPFLTTHSVSGENGQIASLWNDHPQGAVMPVTEWNAEGTVLTVRTDENTDVFTLAKGEDGRTRVGMTRNGEPILTAQ